MSSTISSNPDIVNGPHKCLPSKCQWVTENGDQLSNKKVKTSNGTAAPVQPFTKSVFHQASIENIPEPAAAPSPQPQPDHILEATDGTNDSDDPFEPVNWNSDNDDKDKDNSKFDLDDTTELSMTCIILLTAQLVSILKKMIGKLSKEWDTPIYVFFKLTPSVQYIEGCKAHIFKCSTSHCCGKTRSICQFLDKGDAKFTSNLRHHAKTCWDEEAVAAADST